MRASLKNGNFKTRSKRRKLENFKIKSSMIKRAWRDFSKRWIKKRSFKKSKTMNN